VRFFANQDHAWIFIILIVVAPLIAAWFYRRVPPTVGRGLRVALAALRTIALIILFAALLEPVLALTTSAGGRPLVAVLLDTSRSMSVEDATEGGARGEEAVELLNEVLLERIARDAELEAYGFSETLEPLETGRSGLTGEPSFDGDATDIENALEELGTEVVDRGLGAVVLASDGAANRGGSPDDAGRLLGVPIFVLGVGSADPPVDIAVREVRTNRVSYAGESLPVVARVVSAGFGGEETTVELREDGTLIDSEVVSLSATGEEAEVTFRVEPQQPGTHRYTVSVPTAPGEIVTGNNERVVVTTALRGKFRVLLAADRPGWDFAFLRRQFEGDRNVELTAVSSGAEVPDSREELLSFDLIVLVDPDWVSPPITPELLRAFVSERRGGLAVFGVPEGRPDAWPSFLPGTMQRPIGTSLERRVELTADGASSPLLRIATGRSENLIAWRALPPVWTVPDGTFTAGTAGTELMEAGGQPVAVLGGRPGGGQVLVVLAEGLWRWQMAGENEDLFGRFVSNAARWLTARGEIERVAVTTDADVVPVGGRIAFSGQVYTTELRPETDATVEIAISRGGGAPVAELTLTPVVGGYEGTLTAPSPGSYTYHATASVDGETVGTDEGSFEVEPFALEDADVRRRASALRRLADVTGGAYVTPATLDALPDEIPLERVDRTTTREYELWDTPWLLTAFVALLSVEWALRRRKGMP